MSADVAGRPSTVTGIGIGRGHAVAPLALLRPPPSIPADDRTHDGDAVAAADRAVAALKAVAREFERRAGQSKGAIADVLMATAGIADDSALAAAARTHTGAGMSAAHAVAAAVQQFEDMFLAAGGLMADRVTDLHSVRDHAVADILGVPGPGLTLTRRSVVGAPDLSPADTAALDVDLVAGIVTEHGGPTGHTAIIARQLGIPCIVNASGLTAVPDGALVAIDTATGNVTVDPPDDLVAALERRAAADRELAADTSAGATSDGHRVSLLANIGTARDSEQLDDSAVEGVGLFRTEVLFLGHTTAPTRDDQEPVYRAVVSALSPRKVVVRTLDAGSDKPLAFADMPNAENPALGVRGYRLTRTAPHLLDEQLAALGAVISSLPPDERERVCVMAPMISTASEARDFVSVARTHGITTAGVMIEVPGAALRADDILAEVDFVSIGTNDLAQYVMASDRLSSELTDLVDLWQPAILDLVAITARAGEKSNKPVGVCGESASDPLMALALVGLGVTSLSMSPSAVPAVRYALRRHTRAQCTAIARAALDQHSARGARDAALAAADADVRTRLALT